MRSGEREHPARAAAARRRRAASCCCRCAAASASIPLAPPPLVVVVLLLCRRLTADPHLHVSRCGGSFLGRRRYAAMLLPSGAPRDRHVHFSRRRPRRARCAVSRSASARLVCFSCSASSSSPRPPPPFSTPPHAAPRCCCLRRSLSPRRRCYPRRPSCRAASTASRGGARSETPWQRHCHRPPLGLGTFITSSVQPAEQGAELVVHVRGERARVRAWARRRKAATAAAAAPS